MIVRADAAATAVLAEAPLAVMLADARAPAVLAGAPVAVMLADARAPAVLAVAPAAVMLADARAPKRAALRLSTARVFYTMLCKDVAIICHIYMRSYMYSTHIVHLGLHL